VSLAPLLNAAPATQLHAVAALAAFGLGAVQFAAPKGTLPHRNIGWVWVALMVTVAGELVLDPRPPRLGSVEPDPPALDLHAGDAAACGRACAAPPRRAAPQRHDRHFYRRARRRGPVHAAARPHHARDNLWCRWWRLVLMCPIFQRYSLGLVPSCGHQVCPVPRPLGPKLGPSGRPALKKGAAECSAAPNSTIIFAELRASASAGCDRRHKLPPITHYFLDTASPTPCRALPSSRKPLLDGCDYYQGGSISAACA
jgi:hypothetical protein